METDIVRTSPLPPISRLEGHGPDRQCVRLRRNLNTAFSSIVPALANACETLRPFIGEDDLDRYLEVYDVRIEQIHDAQHGSTHALANEVNLESLAGLRASQQRYNILRRLFLCSLLSLPASGRKEDVARWRVAIAELENLDTIISQVVQNLQDLVTQEERKIFGLLSLLA